jgi:hypothetical protein
LGIVAVQLVTRLQIDAITLGLTAIALLPWLYTFIESAELPGGVVVRFRIHRLQNEQARLGLELDTLKFLITHFLSEDELTHLRAVYHRDVEFGWRKEFREEMQWLWRHRLIKAKHGDLTLKEMESKNKGDKFGDYFEISDAGVEYLRLVDEAESADDAGSYPSSPAAQE